MPGAVAVTSFAEHARLALIEGRRLAESIMADTCKVERPGKPQPDGRGGTTRPMTPVYEGPCRVPPPSQTLGDLTPESGGREFTVLRLEVHFPVGSFAPQVGDVITILDSKHDPLLPGRTYRVAQPHHGATTAYRLGVEEVL